MKDNQWLESKSLIVNGPSQPGNREENKISIVVIKGTPDTTRSGERILGDHWMQSTADQWRDLLTRPPLYVEIDLGNIDFVLLMEWTALVSIVDRVMASGVTIEVSVNIVGGVSDQLLTAAEYRSFSKSNSVPSGRTVRDCELSVRVYRLVGFMESVGTRDALQRRTPDARFYYKHINRAETLLEAYYGARPGRKLSRIMGLTHISERQDCEQFLEAGQILAWRDAMEVRLQSAPLFQNEELWRILCHELAVNIRDHTNGSGFISAYFYDDERPIRPEWGASFPYEVDPRSLMGTDGVLELCVSDAGPGFVQTLAEAFAQAQREHKIDPSLPLLAADILAYAFDQFGTCKSNDECFTTERHALGRILTLVAKYGGLIRLSSSGAEVLYLADGKPFTLRRGQPGYEPTYSLPTRTSLPGAQIQVLLPITPRFLRGIGRSERSRIDANLPRTYAPSPGHVRGLVVPLKEMLNFSAAAAGKTDQRQFIQACTLLSPDYSRYE